MGNGAVESAVANFTSILTLLADGRPHSVAELAANVKLNLETAVGSRKSTPIACASFSRPTVVSRLNALAVSTALQQLRDDGLDIGISKGGEVIWREPVSLLCPVQIGQRLQSPGREWLLPPEVFYSVDSTSSYLARQPAQSQGRVCLAEMQTSGRGRRGNQWISPPCHNLYFSIRWQFECSPALLAGLSLAVGIAVAKVLAPLSEAPVGIKWPNDLYVDGRKLGGILVELLSTSASHADAVIGVGLNINMPDQGQAIDQQWTSLHHHCGEAALPDRNALAADLLTALRSLFVAFPESGAQFIQSQWSDYDLAFGQAVTIHSGDEVVRGIGAGIDEAFRFLLRNADNTRSFHSGDVSLRI